LSTASTRFRDLTEAFADWYWEQDADYRFIDMSVGLNSMGIDPESTSSASVAGNFPWFNMNADDWARTAPSSTGARQFRDLQAAPARRQGRRSSWSR
jgi:hypothetical protein